MSNQETNNELKSAEEWLTDPALGLRSSEHDIVNWVKQIQLNAYKAGMTEAAEITMNYGERLNKSLEPIQDEKEQESVAQWYVHALCNTSKSILIARDNKTTL